MILLLSTAVAGPWTREAGGLYTKLGADFYFTPDYVIPGFGRSTSLGYWGRQYSSYSEIGLPVPWPVQLTMSLPVSSGTIRFEESDSFRTLTAKATTTRVGDLRAGLQTALTDKAPLAAGFDVKVPMYDNGDVGDDHPGFSEVFPLPGDGQVDVTLWLLGGATSKNGRWWAEGQLGYRVRTETYLGWDVDFPLVDGFVAGTTLGGKIGDDQLLVMVKADGVANLAESEITRQGLTLGPALAARIWHGLYLEGRLARDLFVGNGSVGTGFGAGISYVRWPSKE